MSFSNDIKMIRHKCLMSQIGTAKKVESMYKKSLRPKPGRRLFLKRFTGGEGTPPRWCLPPSCSPRTRYRRGV